MAKVNGVGAIVIFLIIYNFNICATTEIEKTAHYDVISDLPHIGPHASITKLRVKRQTPTDLKNQYQSVTLNAPKQTPQPQISVSTESSTEHKSIVVPYNSSDRPLLGVNGTGQRKDAADMLTKPTVVSEPIQVTADTADVAKKTGAFPKKVLGAMLSAANSNETDEVIDTIDVPENDTITMLKNKNFTVNITTDHHDYYNSTIYVNKEEADEIWNRIKDTTPNSMLSQSHRRAMTVELSFDFPFYGHPVRNVTVATGGFLYTGEYVHSWLAATQYVAPLMANFDTSLSNNSFVRLSDNGTAFTVIWENVSLQDKQEVGKFTFSATLHKSGDIAFSYFNVPIFVNAIQDDKHPVKVGLSDAYIIDKVVYFARRKTIYEYHRVNFASAEITNATIIYLKALPTCLYYSDCESCINHKTKFDCAWCPVLNRCSTGTDRKKQEWLQKGCDRAQITDLGSCPKLGDKGNNANKTNNNDAAQQTNSTSNSNSSSSSSDNHTDEERHRHANDADSAAIKQAESKPMSSESKAAFEDPHAHEPKSMGLALGFLVPICLLVTVMVWVMYAYRNPHTKSGQLLIQYRPSQWSWRRGEARYTAATIHM